MYALNLDKLKQIPLNYDILSFCIVLKFIRKSMQNLF